jgi:hypothetical protein
VRLPFAGGRSRRDAEPVPPPAPVSHCARCRAPIAPAQDWCLQCGLAARTRLAPTPDWRVPLLAALVAALLGAGGLAFAFIKLTADDGTTVSTPVTTTTATTPATTPTETTGGTGAQP